VSAVRGPLRKSQATPAGRLSLSVQYQTKRAAPARAQCRRWVKAALALDGGVDCRLTLRFVDSREARSLNRAFRARDYATNVLTFDYHSANMVHADIVICVPVIEREARQQNKDVRAHFAHMVVHGVLHAHGFDHVIARDAKQMESLEGRILARFGISDPYL
jgi:probable rRNA maturation factor